MWKTIDSAPRDGTEVLLGVYIATVWITRAGAWDDGDLWGDQGFKSKDDAAGWWCYCNSVGQEKLEGIYTPTHWAPMPDFPVGDE